VRFKFDLDQLVSFSSSTLLVWSSCLACKNRPQNGLPGICFQWLYSEEMFQNNSTSESEQWMH